MAYLIGTDEAGYGPNLGPLAMAGTLWRVPEGVDGQRLYELLPGICAPGVRNLQHEATRHEATRQEATRQEATLCIGDSKSLYRAASGLGALERGVFAAMAAASGEGRTWFPGTWRELLVGCDKACTGVLETVPWYSDFEGSIPVAASAGAIASGQRVLREALAASHVELVAIRVRLVFPEEFNHRVRACGSKGGALSVWMLELVERLLQPITTGKVLLQSDKHGGRNRYGPLLQQVFPDYLIEIREETRRQSSYCWGPPSRRVEAQFVAKGERFLPAALASMFSKYLRELAMRAFNEFWQQHVFKLRPTAGYPVDAKRFRQEIQAKQRELGISDRVLWRDR
ncbi:MAG: hypothetical protein ACQESR_20135 [Planctomycetota bacterium]